MKCLPQNRSSYGQIGHVIRESVNTQIVSKWTNRLRYREYSLCMVLEIVCRTEAVRKYYKMLFFKFDLYNMIKSSVIKRGKSLTKEGLSVNQSLGNSLPESVHITSKNTSFARTKVFARTQVFARYQVWKMFSTRVIWLVNPLLVHQYHALGVLFICREYSDSFIGHASHILSIY